MKVLVTGASGFIGNALINLLKDRGHEPVPLRRGTAAPGDNPVWDPASGTISAGNHRAFDAIVHLAGESIAAGRWSPERKQRIRDSRTSGTAALARFAAGLDPKPSVMLSASAIGIYGDRGDEPLNEASPGGHGFLADICRDWEAAASPAKEAGIRVAHPRFGLVLGAEGGALQKMLPPFRLGLGGIVGSGRQFYSWISLADTAGALLFALENESIAGPFNVVAPHPVTNRDFTKALARVLNRPAFFPLPAAVARLLLGEMADALLLAGQKVHPDALIRAGYQFMHAELEPALRDILQR